VTVGCLPRVKPASSRNGSNKKYVPRVCDRLDFSQLEWRDISHAVNAACTVSSLTQKSAPNPDSRLVACNTADLSITFHSCHEASSRRRLHLAVFDVDHLLQTSPQTGCPHVQIRDTQSGSARFGVSSTARCPPQDGIGCLCFHIPSCSGLLKMRHFPLVSAVAMAERAGDQAAGMLHANAVRPHPRKERISVPINPWMHDAFVCLSL